MKQKIIYWFRWILAVPASIIIGSIINLILVGLASYVINPSNANSPLQILDILVFPFVIGFVSIQIGSKIAPKYNIKTAKILFGILFLMEIVIVLNAPLIDGNTPIVKAIVALVGGVLGAFLVKKKSFVDNKN